MNCRLRSTAYPGGAKVFYREGGEIATVHSPDSWRGFVFGAGERERVLSAGVWWSEEEDRIIRGGIPGVGDRSVWELARAVGDVLGARMIPVVGPDNRTYYATELGLRTWLGVWGVGEGGR
jgi:hypothetical protein